ncbi:hypothetical protein [Oerskovia turbata]
MKRPIPAAARGSGTSLVIDGDQSLARGPDDAGAAGPPTDSSLAATARSGVAGERSAKDQADHDHVTALRPAPPRTAGAR